MSTRKKVWGAVYMLNGAFFILAGIIGLVLHLIDHHDLKDGSDDTKTILNGLIFYAFFMAIGYFLFSFGVKKAKGI